ncbi:MAG: beta-ketoacyl-ACP synthase II [Acidimicrobiia bacterium]|nr:beta-ketoacyl-ACP synthase II [Acidimicrobiia bacterium]
MRRRVVVTGLGAVTPIGLDVDSTWKSALSGVSGIGQITAFDASAFETRIAGEIPDFDPESYLPKREARRMDRYDQLFWAASAQALEDSGVSFEEGSDEAFRAGVVVGSGIGGMFSFQDGVDTMRQRGPDRVSPFAITQIISNMAGGLVSISFNLFGPNTATVTACAASANAIGDAAEIIRRGAADVMVAGGAEAPVCEFALAGFSNAKALSTRNDDPKGASRPFDATRDGFIMSEGAAVLILEERERAVERGAHIYGEFLGYGMSADGFHVTLPRPGGMGAAMAMKNALADAALEPNQIAYVNAHGTSTKANDTTETAAIKTALGDHATAVPISSTKSMTGHLLGGAGAIEAIMCLLAMRDSVIPPTINYSTPDPECDLDYVPNEARTVQVDAAMSNSFGFGGHNVSLIFGKA